MDNSTDKKLNSEGEVVKGGRSVIEIRFETLINANCEAPFDWYKDLGMDKSHASKIRRGLVIPPKWWRIKIAQYFKTDSATIWTTEEINQYFKDKPEKFYREEDLQQQYSGGEDGGS